MFDLEINHGTCVWYDKAESSGRKWALNVQLGLQCSLEFVTFQAKSQGL